MVAVLRLEGLPFKATIDEIDDFFSESDVRVERVHLLLNRDLRPSGTGFVELSDSDTKTAMQLSGKCIADSRRYVKIVKSDSDELDWHLRRQKLTRTSKGSDGFFCVRMYGLPFKVNEYQIACWYDTVADCVDVQIHLNQEGRASGDATAYFQSEDMARSAMKRNKEDMEGRYINLSMDSVTATFNNSTGHNSDYCVKMSGVPFRATEQELKEFFRDAEEPLSVKVILNRDGRPSGDALAEFDSEEAVNKAMSKDRECMGSRYVILTREDGGRGNRGFDRKRDSRDRDHRRDMEHRNQRSPRNDQRGERRRIHSDRDRDNSRDRSYRTERGGYRTDGPFTIKMGGLPYRATVNEIIDWFHPRANCIDVRILRGRDNRPNGNAIAEFETQYDAKKAMENDREYMGERYIDLQLQ